MAKSTTKLLQEVLQTTEAFGEEKTIEVLQKFRKENILSFVCKSVTDYFKIEQTSLLEKTDSDRVKYALAFCVFFSKQFSELKNEDLVKYYKRSQPRIWRLERLITSLSEKAKFDRPYIEAKAALEPIILQYKQTIKLS